ncbi:hypothetical protein QR98_0044970 [Sarcoptes scabiei]|uniref:Integrase zinc-binding domain-containing protein n=1 Tax=Sarcoptes scabiei TaxID=52283 RepID=A0A132A510_SARSC|nr:hypothetical protein QR98_0044970 [Sarcoptes scabiei]
MALTSCDSDEDESEKIEREFLSREKAKQELLRIHLDYGHIGYAQMVEHFNIKYLCEGLRDLAKAIANECDTCLRTKPNKKRLGLLGQIGPATYPFQIIHIDTVGVVILKSDISTWPSMLSPDSSGGYLQKLKLPKTLSTL